MSSWKPKIFYIYTSAWYKGSNQDEYDRSLRERFIVDFSRSLGYDCRLLFISYSPKIEKMTDATGGIFFPVDDPNCYNAGNHTSTDLLKFIESEGPDFIIFKGMGNLLSRWLVAKSCHKFRYGFIVGGKTNDLILRYSDYVLAEHNHQIEKFFNMHYEHASADILPKLLNPDEFTSNVEQEKEFDIVSVGRLSPHKNYKALIPFFEKFRVALIGDGPCFDELKLIADKYPNNVYMPGSLPRNEVLKYIRRSRLLVHPCRWEQKLEGFPRVLAESFACGVPVVVFKETIPDGFLNGIHGLMVSEENLEKQVKMLLSDEERLDAMGAKAFIFAKKSYTQEAVAYTISKMYVNILRPKSKFHVYYISYTIKIIYYLKAFKLFVTKILRH